MTDCVANVVVGFELGCYRAIVSVAVVAVAVDGVELAYFPT